MIILSSILLINLRIYTTFFVIWLIVMYLALVIEVDIILCFLLHYNTIILSRKNYYPMIDLYSSKSLTNLLFI